MPLSTSLKMLSFASLLCFMSAPASATIVLIKTNMGDFEVNLFDQSTPQTVNNFLTYVRNGSFNQTIFHRSVPNFIVQGGGFRYTGNNSDPFAAVPTLPAIQNEARFSNVRGTIAMAKLSGQPNSATNQWFINLVDNSQNLDVQNSGFTVFGQVTGNGMEIVDAIAKLPNNLVTGFQEVPLQKYSAADAVAKVPVTAANLVRIESITVINNDPASAANLKPVPNTLIQANRPAEQSSGGSLQAWLLAGLALLLACRRYRAQ